MCASFEQITFCLNCSDFKLTTLPFENYFSEAFLLMKWFPRKGLFSESPNRWFPKTRSMKNVFILLTKHFKKQFKAILDLSKPHLNGLFISRCEHVLSKMRPWLAWYLCTSYSYQFDSLNCRSMHQIKVIGKQFFMW